MNPSQLYDWTPSAQLSYGDFLRAKQLDAAIVYLIENRHKELIATNQQLAERGIEILSTGLGGGLSMLSQGGRPAAAAGQETAGEAADRFSWGYSEDLLAQGGMSIPLDELVKLTKTPAQAWAYEQFEIARDEFRRQLYPQALQSATRAIEGQGDKPGNKGEFRFHLLLGIIRLGSYRNSSAEVINPRLAQQAFLAAARNAESSHPADAGLALICAGRAALVDGDIENAVTHTRRGLNFLPTHAAGLYQLGRALFFKGARSEATDRLADAMLQNAEYALHAASDPGLVAKMDFLEGVLRQAYERCAAHHRQVAERFRQARQTLLSYSFRDVPASELPLKGFAEIQKAIKTAEELALNKTMFAYHAATDYLLDRFQLFPICFEEFKTHCIQRLQEQVLRPPRREDFLQSDPAEKPKNGLRASRAWLVSGVVSGIMVFLLQSSRTPQGLQRGPFESLTDLLLIPLFCAFGIAIAVAMLESLYSEYLRAKQKSALAAFDAAWYSYSSLKASLEKEIAAIKDMALPRECAPPSRASLSRPGAAAEVPPTQKRGSAWAKL